MGPQQRGTWGHEGQQLRIHGLARVWSMLCVSNVNALHRNLVHCWLQSCKGLGLLLRCIGKGKIVNLRACKRLYKAEAFFHPETDFAAQSFAPQNITHQQS